MTFAVLVLAALGLPVGITEQLYLRDDLNQSAMGQLMKLVRTILKVVGVCVIAGAAALSISFIPQFGLWQGLWEALFHSISAFNNAGFACATRSLRRCMPALGPITRTGDYSDVFVVDADGRRIPCPQHRR